MKHILTPILLLAAASFFQGCEKKEARPAAEPTAPAAASAPAATPAAAPVAPTAPTTPAVAPAASVAEIAKVEAAADPAAAESLKVEISTSPDAPKPAEEAKPIRVGATSADDFNPATDIVLGWWKTTFDAFDEKRVSTLWPTDADDSRTLKTIRFLNDSMATNGCCAGAEWGFVAPKFYKVDREIHELYYLPDDGTLYFLARLDPKESAKSFQKIVTEINSGKSVEELAKSGLIEAPAKFVRFQPR
jgi:hypothetical protein